MTRAEQLEAAADAWRDALGKAKAAEARRDVAQEGVALFDDVAMGRDLTAEERAAWEAAHTKLLAADAALREACATQDAALDAILQIAAAPSS